MKQNYQQQKRSEETCLKISQSLKQKFELKYTPRNLKKYHGPHTKIYRGICKCCHIEKWMKRGRFTCSYECALKNSTKRKTNITYYKNGIQIKMDSTWEIQIAQYLDQHNIIWIRPKHLNWIDSSGKERRYFPDFYLPDFDLYLDPKNDYNIKIGQEKLEYFKEKIHLIYGKTENLIDYINKLAPSCEFESH